MTMEISELPLEDLDRVSGGIYIPWDVFVTMGMGGSLGPRGSAGNAPSGIGAGGARTSGSGSLPPKTIVMNPTIQRNVRAIRGGKSAWETLIDP